MTVYELSNKLSNGGYDEVFSRIYGDSDSELLRQRARLLNAAEKFSRLCPECEDIRVFSVPGRTEIGGNHTDHQHGCVLAAAVTLDITAIAGINDDGRIRICSEGFDPVDIAADETTYDPGETGTVTSIVRGISAKFAELGIEVGGFDAYISSDIPIGAGLSSSAAFEVLIGSIIDHFFNDGKMDMTDIAKIGQYAENEYFGKGSGLMDQLVCAVGGFISIDLKDPDIPSIRQIDADFLKSGHSLCIVDTRGSHADLSGDYSGIPEDMKTVAVELGAEYLGDADEDEFYEKLPDIREKCTDRAILRAIHFFDENKRAVYEAEELSNGRLTEFFGLVNDSGDSSAMLLQNLHSAENRDDRELMLGIALSRRFLRGCGAVRVHGGGFAGTIQAFVPTYMVGGYRAEMERIFGEGSCMVMSIRPCGSTFII